MSRPSIPLRRKIIYAAVTTGVLLAMANGAVALYEKVQYGGSHAEKEGIYITREDGRKVLRPGASLQGAQTRIQINQLGFRGPELDEPKPQNGFRVWCVGGSTTFDVFAPDDHLTWPALLGERLQEAHPDRRIEVVNAGIPGEILAGSLEDFEAHFDAVLPDLLVIYHGPNDLRDIRFGGPAPPTGELEQEFALFRATRGAINRQLPQLPEAWADNRLSSHQMGDLELRFIGLIEAAQRRGVHVLISSHALQSTIGASDDEALRQVGELCVLMQMHPGPVMHLYEDFNKMMAGMAERLRLPFADVRAAVPADDAYWGDALHFSAKGSVLAADAMAQTILEAAWL